MHQSLFISYGIMRKTLLLLLFATISASVMAQSTRKLRSFFTEKYVQNLFYYAHPNASSFEGIDVVSVESDEVVVKASFVPGSFLGSLFGGTYTCKMRIEVDGDEHFTRITTDCNSGASSNWPCFKWASDELIKKCRDASRSSRSIDYMERLYDKRLRSFTGDEAMCTLLTIALYNYDW